MAGAKQVHVFDRTADETISWIQEKDSSLTAEGYAQDLESIQALVRKHEVFQTDLAAVKEQVCSYLFIPGFTSHTTYPFDLQLQVAFVIHF